jgi:hypothetical protein
MTAVPTATMVTDADQLAAALAPMATDYADTHHTLIEHLPGFMRSDGAIEVTVRDLSKRSGVPFSAAKEYLRVARQRGLLHLLGRRVENGQLRYCAYRTTEDRS